MEASHKSISSVALTFGLVTGLVMILYNLVLYVFEATTNQYLSYVSYVILLIGMFLAIKSYRDKETGGTLSYGQGIGLGTLLALFASLLSGIFTFILYKYIDPQAIEPMIQAAREKMYQQGLEGEQLEQSMAMTKQFIKPHWMALSGIFYTTLIGLLLSLVVSVFLKRTK